MVRAWLPRDASETTRRHLRRLGVRGEELDDLCQSVLAIAVRRQIQATHAWLQDTARKQTANHRILYRHRYEVLDPGPIDAAAVDPMVQELHLDVHRALAELGPADAELLVRHLLDGEPLRKLGQDLGLSKSGARLRVARARKRFVEVLG